MGLDQQQSTRVPSGAAGRGVVAIATPSPARSNNGVEERPGPVCDHAIRPAPEGRRHRLDREIVVI